MKRLLGLLLAATFFCSGLQVWAEEFSNPDFDVPCRGAVLIDQSTGSVLYQKQADTQMPIASITKVMTLLLTMEALENGKVTLQDIVPISEHSYNMGGSQIWLEPGEQFTLDELIKAICVSSANDAAVAVAEYVGGSEPVFVEQMNRKAAELGMTHTHFENACGLDAPGHLSSPRDVAILSREILTKHPDITHYTTIWMDSLRGGATQLVNTNKLLRSYNGITGLKTGTTGGAGVCVSASATRDGLSLIAVVLGSTSGQERWQAARTLLDYGFASFRMAEPTLPSDAPRSIPVVGGESTEVGLDYAALEPVLLKKEDSAPTVTIQLPQQAEAPIQQGQQLGIARILANGQEIGQCPVTAAAAVPKMNFSLALKRLWQAWAAA